LIIKNKPISEQIHHYIVEKLKSYGVKTVIDIGGTGKLNSKFVTTNANICKKIDGSNLPYNDKTFDGSVSIATLEHVVKEKQIQFLQESIRVAKLVSLHWFPCGKMAQEAEDLKHKLGHQHPCNLPEEFEIRNFIDTTKFRYIITPLQTIVEHMLLLSTMYPYLNVRELYNFLYSINLNSHYGILVEIIL